MKKFAALMIALMTLVCSVSAVAAPSALTKEDAMQAALDHVGLTHARVDFTEACLDKDVWEMTFIHEGKAYGITVDAHTGRILAMDVTRHASHDLDFLSGLV